MTKSKHEANSTIPWFAFQFSICGKVCVCQIVVTSTRSSVFLEKFIWELHSIFNFPKYILLDPYKRNLNKYNNIKLSLLQQSLNIYFH